MPETTADTVRAELQRRRRAILETTRRADAELDALRSAERDPEFEEGAQTEHETFTLSRLGEAQRRELAQIDAAIARSDTGGAGFIGSHLCERLLGEGHDVLCLDNFFTGRKSNVAALLGNPRLELIRHDVASGGARYLQKPVDIRALSMTVRETLDAAGKFDVRVCEDAAVLDSADAKTGIASTTTATYSGRFIRPSIFRLAFFRPSNPISGSICRFLIGNGLPVTNS